MGYNTYGNPHTADFIARKIRPDGCSTFRRGAMPAVDPARCLQTPWATTLLARSVPRASSGGPAGSERLRLHPPSNRVAMWCAQLGTESGGLRWMEEIADGSEYEVAAILAMLCRVTDDDSKGTRTHPGHRTIQLPTAVGLGLRTRTPSRPHLLRRQPE